MHCSDHSQAATVCATVRINGNRNWGCIDGNRVCAETGWRSARDGKEQGQIDFGNGVTSSICDESGSGSFIDGNAGGSRANSHRRHLLGAGNKIEDRSGSTGVIGDDGQSEARADRDTLRSRTGVDRISDRLSEGSAGGVDVNDRNVVAAGVGDNGDRSKSLTWQLIRDGNGTRLRIPCRAGRRQIHSLDHEEVRGARLHIGSREHIHGVAMRLGEEGRWNGDVENTAADESSRNRGAVQTYLCGPIETSTINLDVLQRSG